VNVTKVGTGGLTMAGANYYFGGTTTVSAGSLIAAVDAISSTTMDGTNTNLSIASNVFNQSGHGLVDGDRIAFTSGSGALSTITQYYVVNATTDTFQVSTTSGGSPLTGITDAAAGVTRGIQAGAFGGGSSAIVVGDSNTAAPSAWNPAGNNTVNLLTGAAVTIERAVTVADTGSTGVAGIGGLAPVNSTFSGQVTFHRDLSVGQTTDGGTVSITGGLRGAGASAKTLTFGNPTVVPIYAPNAFFGNVDVSSVIDETDGGAVSVEVLGGNVTFGGNNLYSGTTTVTAGKLLVNGTHTGGGAYSVADGATLGGTGTIGSSVAINSNATLSPGASVGTLSVGSADIDGKLLIEYNGDTSTIDMLTVSGSLDITNAILDFDNLGSAALGGGPYVFASYGSLIGSAFSSVVDPPAGFSIDYSYLGNQIALISSTVQSGDFDGDGDVDGADFVVWQTNFPKTGTGSQSTGDANGDGNVDGGDFAVWQDQFPTPSGGGASPVPEPGAVALAAIGFISVFVCLRKKQK
jgi:autotransporter-associated beta strand protein